MQVFSAGKPVVIRERRWPLAGLDQPTEWANGGATLALTSSPEEQTRLATYATVYRTNPWVFAAVSAISWALSRLPLKLYQKQADGSSRELAQAPPGAVGALTNEQRLAQLLEMPAPGVSIQEWLRKLAVDKLVYGNALFLKELRTDNAQVPDALHHVRWSAVSTRTGETVPILGYFLYGAKKIPKRTDEVIHFGRSGDLDRPIGLSPLEPLRYTISLYDAVARHLNAYFANSARPSGMIKLAPTATRQQIELAQEAAEKQYTSPENAGRVMVSTGDFQAIMKDPQQSSIVELSKLSREEIAAAFQVPPPVLGILERAIQSNVVELRSQFLRDVVGPHAASIEGDLNAQLIWSKPELRAKGLYVAFDMTQALRPDLEVMGEVFQKVRHILTTDEMRDLIGYSPIQGDELVRKYMTTTWQPSGQIPVGLPQPQTKDALDTAREIPGAIPGVAPVAPASTGLQAPYYGRAGELEALHTAVAAMIAQRDQVV